jgi:hypothetical protein
MDRVTIADAIEAPARTVDFSKQPFEERWGYSGPDAYATTVLLDRCYGLVAADRG